MKRRLIKKWIKRYITPEIKGMPATIYRGFEVNVGGLTLEYVGESHSFIDGYEIPEGGMIRRDSNKRSAIMKMADLIRDLKSKRQYVYVRQEPIYQHGVVRMRFITEKVST